MTLVNEAPPPAAGALSVTKEEGGIAVITLDLPGESVNKISTALGTEMLALLDRLEHDGEVRGVVIISGKPDIFIAGADIDQFLELRTVADAEALSRGGQAMMARLAESRLPIVAAINGACLGGGLELALACHYRIATEHPKTVLALPEVMLGLIPGAGGTQRLPRTVGLRNALDMILTGKNVRPKKALQIGLVDEMVHPAILRDVALDRARQLAAGKIARVRKRRSRGAAGLVLEDNRLGRKLIYRQARDQTLKRTHGNYPAPIAAIDAIATGLEEGMDLGFAAESRLFGEMAHTEASRQLIFLFYATNALKKDRGVDIDVEPLPVDKLGVLGAGFMGAGIAAVAVQQGTAVRLKDASLERVGKGLKSVSDVLRERLKKKQIGPQQYEDMMSLVGGTVDYSGFAGLDLVIEAVFEDLAVKQQVVREVEAAAPSDAIVASNTSTIPIARIAEASRRPEQVLGMHFFSPVPKMPLLEVIVTPRTSAVATATAVAYGKKLGKHVIVVNDAPGFYANRILSPYINEAGRLLDEGVAIEAIDRALVDFGFPVGPIKLLDEVGLDIAGHSGQIMHDAFGERMAPAESIRRVVESGRKGRKERSGFYKYDENGKSQGVDETVYALLRGGAHRVEMPAEAIQRRCVLAMVNEAARTLEEGIVRRPRDGDIGAVFGIGFPPFRGGPFRYIDTVGVAQVVRQLEDLHARFAPRYEPAKLLVDMAARGERFYPAPRAP